MQEIDKMTKEEVIKELTKIKGVTKTKAEIVYKNGFDSLEKLKKVKTSDLEKIEGITSSMAKNIVKQISTKSKMKPTKTKAPAKGKTKETQKKVEERSARARALFDDPTLCIGTGAFRGVLGCRRSLSAMICL